MIATFWLGHKQKNSWKEAHCWGILRFASAAETWLAIHVEPTCWKKASHTFLTRFSWLYARGQVFAYADFHDHQTTALSLSLSMRSSIPDVPSRNSSPKKECEFWICFLMDCFARVLHCLPYNFPSSISSVWSSTTYKKSPATVNQHPPVHHEGWMVSSQETVFCWVPVP
jgi:hypothetical protein